MPLERDYTLDCSIARALGLIGERWSLLVIRDIFLGNRRFSEIQESLGIARNVLTSRLERLIDEGIIERRPYSEKPLRYEYFLTEKGLDLWPAIIGLMHFGDKHLTEGEPPMRVIHKECGGEINRHRVCTSCGKALEVYEAKAVGPATKTEAAA